MVRTCHDEICHVITLDVRHYGVQCELGHPEHPTGLGENTIEVASMNHPIDES
jgi:hypothetical protein